MSNVWVPTSSKGSSGGSGTVTSVSSADTSIAVTNPTTTPSLKLATLDVIATNEAPVAAVPMNAQKFTGLANGTLATDSAAFGQIPTSLPPSGSAGGDLTGTYPNPTIAASAVTTAKLASAVTLDAIATAHATAADVNMNSHKITNLTNGAGAQDAAAFGQIPTALPPNGSAGGDLTGSYPNPTVGAAKITTAKLAAAVTLDAIATANATAASVPMNTQKFTGLAAGTTNGDSVRFEQLATAGPISSVFTRTGAVAATSGDYTAAQVTNAFDKSSSSVQGGAGGFRSTNATNANGYATGAGGTVTQLTSRATAVTINTPTGRIVTFNSSMAAGASFAFTVNNTSVGIIDTVQISFTNDSTASVVLAPYVAAVQSGSFVIVYANNSGGSASTALNINFTVTHGINS